MNTKLRSLYIATASGLTSLVCLGTPSPGPATEAERTDFLQVAYESTPRLADSEIDVQISDHIATLSGEANTIDQADYAVAVALATNGVYGVVNRIEIDANSELAGDVAAKTKAALADTSILNASNVTVASHNGVLSLSGTVSTMDERELARELASRIKGVSEIQNRLEVSFSEPRSENAIQKQLELQFGEDPLFDLLPIDIKVEDATVTLSGSVGSLDEKEGLMRNSQVTGVMDVDASKLEINSDLRMEGMADKDYHPSDTMKVARLVFAADPRISSPNIQLEMIGGTMVLSGSVSDPAALKAAQSDARGVPGVLGVMNRLQTNNALSSR